MSRKSLLFFLSVDYKHEWIFLGQTVTQGVTTKLMSSVWRRRVNMSKIGDKRIKTEDLSSLTDGQFTEVLWRRIRTFFSSLLANFTLSHMKTCTCKYLILFPCFFSWVHDCMSQINILHAESTWHNFGCKWFLSLMNAFCAINPTLI